MHNLVSIKKIMHNFFSLSFPARAKSLDLDLD